jgi:sugar phosphate isomerase/epimerase
VIAFSANKSHGPICKNLVSTDWWRGFCAALTAIGYDDVLSIEHEDMALPPLDGVVQSVALLRRVIPTAH